MGNRTPKPLICAAYQLILARVVWVATGPKVKFGGQLVGRGVKVGSMEGNPWRRFVGIDMCAQIATRYRT